MFELHLLKTTVLINYLAFKKMRCLWAILKIYVFNRSEGESATDKAEKSQKY